MKVLAMLFLSGFITSLGYNIVSTSYKITAPFGMTSLLFIGSWAVLFMAFSLVDLRESS